MVGRVGRIAPGISQLLWPVNHTYPGQYVGMLYAACKSKSTMQYLWYQHGSVDALHRPSPTLNHGWWPRMDGRRSCMYVSYVCDHDPYVID